jgi:tRNA(Glu) U13 pseudouridine synthase TruD
MKLQVTYPYLANSEGTGGELKNPEDFIVEEIIEDKFLRKFSRSGGKVIPVEKKFGLFSLRKRLLTTDQAVKRIAEKLKVDKRVIGYAGLKDKFAVTYQYLTIPAEIKVPQFVSDDLILKKIGYTDKKMNLGDLIGNEFTITLHGAKHAKSLREIEVFPNYFGPQRFGKHGKNAVIGKFIIKKDFKRALVDINKLYGANFTDLKQIEKRRLKFFVHAYQSFLFNWMLASGKKATIPGHDFVPASIRKKEGITKNHFKIRELKMSFRGGERSLFIQPKIEHKMKGKKMVFTFTLPKGSYASVIMRELMKKEWME